MLHRFCSLIFPVLLLTVVQSCSSTFENRQPKNGFEVQKGDTLLIHRPKNSTIGLGRTFSDLKGTEILVKDLSFHITAFPRADRRLQNDIVSILENEEDEQVRTGKSDITIPYRRSPDRSSLELSVQKSDREVIPQKSDMVDLPGSSSDLVVSGRIEKGLAGTGEAVERANGQRVPAGYALFRLETVWRVSVPDEGRSKRFRINDEALVNFSVYQKNERLYRLKTAFDQLLRRVAWRLVSRLIPHQYDTSFERVEE